MDIEKPSMIVCELRKRWGSDDAAGNLRVNWRIVQAPIPLIEYALVHELLRRTQSSRPVLLAAVERWMPDFEDRRRELREIGPRLAW